MKEITKSRNTVKCTRKFNMLKHAKDGIQGFSEEMEYSLSYLE